MKKIVCNQPNELEIVSENTSMEIGKNEVLIAIKKIGICGTDIHAYSGNQPFFDYPRILGHELSGFAEEVGEEVDSVKKGDQLTVIPYVHCGECVACKNDKTNCCVNMQVIGVHRDGGMTNYLKVAAENTMVVNELSMEDAAIVEPLSISSHAVRRADIKPGETVMIIGAGPIGMGAARFAKLAGAKTILMDINEERLIYAKEWTESDFIVIANDHAEEKIIEFNKGALPTVVLDATGNKHSMMKAFDYVSHGGKLVYIGLVKEMLSFFNPDFHSKELTLMGSRNATREDFSYVIEKLSKGYIKAGFVTNHIDFEDVPNFFKEGNFQTNKTLITIK